MTGVRFRAPLGSGVAFIGRGDVAGFGSKLTWNLEGDLAVALSQRWTLGARAGARTALRRRYSRARGDRPC